MVLRPLSEDETAADIAVVTVVIGTAVAAAIKDIMVAIKDIMVAIIQDIMAAVIATTVVVIMVTIDIMVVIIGGDGDHSGMEARGVGTIHTHLQQSLLIQLLIMSPNQCRQQNMFPRLHRKAFLLRDVVKFWRTGNGKIFPAGKKGGVR